MGPLRLEPGEQTQGLRVALEPADVGGDRVEHRLPVVAERRVPEVVGQAGRVDEVRVAPESGAELPSDLRHLERVGEPVAHEVVVPGCDDLGLPGKPAQRGGVHEPRAVPGEVVAVGADAVASAGA